MADIFSTLNFKDEDIIHFPEGIPGFEKNTKYAMVCVKEQLPFEWLVSTEETRLRFVVVNPMLFRPDYNPNVSKFQIEPLKIRTPDELRVLAIVTMKTDVKESTANLVGPLFINTKLRIGKQLIIEDDQYSTQERIIR